MTFSEETMQMADQILESADLGGDFIEHYGVKGQKRGVRRYQNEDGSLTDLGRRHYGIFERMRNYFSPASKGYRAAQKQKKIDEKIKYQQKVNELKRLKNESKEEEYRIKQMKRADKEERKARKFEQDIREKELESRERQFNLQQKTMLDIQKQKDNAQLAREQAQREYQTQQEIAKGKTLLGRLQKGAKLVAAVSGIAGSGKKIAEAIGIDTSKFVTEWAAKYGDDSSPEKPKSEKPKSEKTSTEKPKTDISKPDTPQQTNQPENNRNRFRMDLSGWDPNKQYTWSINNQGGNQNKPRLTFDTSGWDPNNKQTWSPSNETGQKKKISIDLSGWDPNTQYTWNKEGTQQKKLREEMENAPQYIDTASDKDKSRGIKVLELNSNSSKNWSTQEEWLAERAKEQDFKDMVDSISYYNNKEKNERKIIRQAQERAQEIVENARTVKINSTGPLSDTVKYVTSLGTTKLANMLSGEVPYSIPNKINLGSLMSTKIEQNPTYLEELRANKKIKHEDMDEEEIAGEIEDAE